MKSIHHILAQSEGVNTCIVRFLSFSLLTYFIRSSWSVPHEFVFGQLRGALLLPSAGLTAYIGQRNTKRFEGGDVRYAQKVYPESQRVFRANTGTALPLPTGVSTQLAVFLFVFLSIPVHFPSLGRENERDSRSVLKYRNGGGRGEELYKRCKRRWQAALVMKRYLFFIIMEESGESPDLGEGASGTF